MKWFVRKGVSVEGTEPQFIRDGVKYHPAWTKLLYLLGGYILRNEGGEELDAVIVERNGERINGTEAYPNVMKIPPKELEDLSKQLGW